MCEMGEPIGPMQNGTTYIVRPRMQPSNSARRRAFISRGSTQLLVGPASSLRIAADEGAVLDPRHVRGIGAGQEAAGALVGSSGTSVPPPTSSPHSRRYSCSEPSHQTMRCGRVRFATSITHWRRRWCRTYSGISGLAEAAGLRRVAASTATLSSRDIVRSSDHDVSTLGSGGWASATIVDT